MQTILFGAVRVLLSLGLSKPIAACRPATDTEKDTLAGDSISGRFAFCCLSMSLLNEPGLCLSSMNACERLKLNKS